MTAIFYSFTLWSKKAQFLKEVKSVHQETSKINHILLNDWDLFWSLLGELFTHLVYLWPLSTVKSRLWNILRSQSYRHATLRRWEWKWAWRKEKAPVYSTASNCTVSAFNQNFVIFWKIVLFKAKYSENFVKMHLVLSWINRIACIYRLYKNSKGEPTNSYHWATNRLPLTNW